MIEENEGITLTEYQKAYRTMRSSQAKIGFVIHSVAYVVVNSLLATINLLFVPGVIWFVFPLVGWGFGLALHYTLALRLSDRFLSAEEARAEHLAKAHAVGTSSRA